GLRLNRNLIVDSNLVPLERRPGDPFKFKRLLSGEDNGPWAILSWEDPNGEIPSHYHPTDQFQVVLEGQASFPDHSFEVLDIHYADSRALYGPISMGKDGMMMAVLRRRKVGIVHMDFPVRKPALEERNLVGFAKKSKWEKVNP